MTFHPCWLAANVNADGAPIYGGTLKIEGNEDVSAFLDPQGEYGAVGVIVERAYTRQLVSNPASTNVVTAESIVPDAATAMPIISANALTYTFHIRSGVMWNTSPARQVTSQDFERGIERTCDPTLATAGNPGYYTATINGLLAFCQGFESLGTASSAAARAAYINEHGDDVSGIQTPDSLTIVFTLTQPASDFLDILTQPFASAAPVEDLGYVPVTAGSRVYRYSDGPYQISHYDDAREIDLDHNSAWRQSTDPIRHQYVKKIDIKLDVPGSGAPQEVQDDLETGVADLEWDTRVPAQDVEGLISPAWNPEYGDFPHAGVTGPIVRFNVLSPNNNGALRNPQVREALEYAINKVEIGVIFGGPSVTQPLNQVIGPGAEGYIPFNDYPTPGNEGDPGECKRLLAAAGYPNGLTLTDEYENFITPPVQVFREVQMDFRKCGVIVKGDPEGDNFNIFQSAEDLKNPATWDITSSTGWVPDWFGPRNGRAILPDLFQGNLGIPGVGDLGGYDDPAVDTLITAAESALTLTQATSDWHEADEDVMADAAFIPLQTQNSSLFRSARVHNAIYCPNLNGTYDITQVWLSP